MPRQRIPLAFTNKNKVGAVDAFAASTENRSDFCRVNGINRSTHRSWERRAERIRSACENKRASKLTVGGSGRRSESHVVEDALVTWVKDQRREELPVTREGIVLECLRLLLGFLADKTEGARLAWCDRFMQRSGLSIRRISHSGRKSKDELMKYKEAFALEVSAILIDHFLDSATGTPPPFVLYNMDQTSVYCNLGARTTVDFKGVKRVPCKLAGKGGYRCTVALTACADGRFLAPHFVFKGKPGGDVQDEVEGYCDGENATCAVQKNAWFDEEVMLDWIERVWKYEVTGPTVLILDSLKIHQLPSVRETLAAMGTFTVYVPGGTTSVCQPLDVGIMGPFKARLRRLYVEMYTGVTPPLSAFERRRDMIVRTLTAVAEISADVVRSAFVASGPFLPFGPKPQNENTAVLEAIV